MATVSVVIPCFNHGEFLPDAVASVRTVNREDLELVVVDDGSTDDRTCREMARLRERGIQVIRQENRGLAAARNAGISASTGRYILPLDADNRLRPKYIEHGIEILDADPQAGIVYGDAEFIGKRTGRWNVGPFKAERLLEWNYIDACAMFRRVVWEQNGGYDSTMPTQGLEDWDFWLGALERGWKFAYVSEVLFDYRVAQESMITRTTPFEKEIREFIGRKHGRLYQQVWLSAIRERQLLLNERQSVKWTLRNLRRLITERLKRRLCRNGTS